MRRTVVVALGGNAILQSKQKGNFKEQLTNVKIACKHIAKLVAAEHKVIITHGNGPQIGNILIQNEAASYHVPPMPLAVCVAKSQGMIGSMIEMCLCNILEAEGINKNVTTVLTHVKVEKDDPAFKRPTKPIGKFYSKDKALRFMVGEGENWIEDNGRGWRKVVASPKPIDILEIETISNLIENDTIVIACGGGGIPVIVNDSRILMGTEAVIDKDLASSLLAQKIRADMLLILTNVSKVAINYGKPDQKNLDCITISGAKRYLTEGYFGSGSMGPKIEAAINFAATGGEAVIASLAETTAAIKGEAGTRIIADNRQTC